MAANPNWQPHSLAQALARLPLIARRKYESLQALASDSGMLANASFERGKAAQERALGIKRRLGYLDRASEADTIREFDVE